MAIKHVIPPAARTLAIIMGGGAGKRLFPLTKSRAKPAVPIGAKYRLVDIPISNCLNSGIRGIYVLTQFNSTSLHRHINASYKFDHFTPSFVEILAAQQTPEGSTWYQGTADAVRQNIRTFLEGTDEYFIILSGDQLYRMDYRDVLQQHITANAELTIACIPVNREAAAAFGIMETDASQRITRFVEKPSDPMILDELRMKPELLTELGEEGQHDLYLASMGIYVFNRAVLAEALDNTMTDFGREIIPGLLGRKKLFAYMFEGYWEDIGTVRAFFEANLALAQPLPPFNFFDPTAPIYTQDRYLPASKLNKCAIDHVVIGDGSILTNSSIKHSVLGIRSYVGEGSVLEDTVLMGADYYETDDQLAANLKLGRPHLGVGRNCRVRGAIIDKNARIGDGCVLYADGKSDGAYANGAVIVRDGVLVVPKGGLIPPGTVV